MSCNINYLRGFVIASACALTTQACVWRIGDGSGLDDDDGSWQDDSSHAQGGTGGAGNSDAPGGGGSAPSVDCLGPEGTSLAATVCDELAINVGQVCGDDGDEPAISYLSCVHGFQIFNPGHAESFASCLGSIGADQACETDPVGDCAVAVYDDTCEIDYIDELCTDMSDYCNNQGDALDVATCSSTLYPINPESINSMIGCMNQSLLGTCGERFDSCFDELITIY